MKIISNKKEEELKRCINIALTMADLIDHNFEELIKNPDFTKSEYFKRETKYEINKITDALLKARKEI